MHQVEPGGRRRHHYSRAFKRQIVEETLAGDRSVSQIARDLDVNANLVFRWRRAYREGRFDDRASLIPVNVVADDSAESTSAVADPRPTASRPRKRPIPAEGHLSITTAGGHHVAVPGAVDLAVLQAALAVLR
ncbi:MAG: IS66-like element accessory protein TnpA [Halothiobacillaceae bacterium]